MGVSKGCVLPWPTLPTSPVEIPVSGSSKMRRPPSSFTGKHEMTFMRSTKRGTMQMSNMVGMGWEFHTLRAGKASGPSFRSAVARKQTASEIKWTCAVSVKVYFSFIDVFKALKCEAHTQLQSTWCHHTLLTHLIDVICLMSIKEHVSFPLKLIIQLFEHGWSQMEWT